MTTPRLSVRTSPPWEGLGRLPYYCSQRDAANEMPLKALVLIFVSLPLSPFLVLGVSFLLLLVLFSVCCSITKKKFLLRLLSLFSFLQRRCKTDGYKATGCDRSDSKFRIGILKCFLGMFLFTMPLCASCRSMRVKGRP